MKMNGNGENEKESRTKPNILHTQHTTRSTDIPLELSSKQQTLSWRIIIRNIILIHIYTLVHRHTQHCRMTANSLFLSFEVRCLCCSVCMSASSVCNFKWKQSVCDKCQIGFETFGTAYKRGVWVHVREAFIFMQSQHFTAASLSWRYRFGCR